MFPLQGKNGILEARKPHLFWMQRETQSSQQAMEIPMETFARMRGISPVVGSARAMLGTPKSLQYITRTLVQGRVNEEMPETAMIIQELAADPQNPQAIGATHGLEEGLIRMIQHPHSLKATKAAITALYYLAREKPVRVKLVKDGAIPALLEIIPEGDKGLCERSLGVIDLLCSCEEGGSAAYEHALTVPVVVKQILRVSNEASQFAVSILWTLCRNSSNGCVMLDSLQAGAFQKLLVLLQLGCSDDTRKRATQLLKLFKHYSEVWECIDSSDFIEAKRSF